MLNRAKSIDFCPIHSLNHPGRAVIIGIHTQCPNIKKPGKFSAFFHFKARLIVWRVKALGLNERGRQGSTSNEHHRTVYKLHVCESKQHKRFRFNVYLNKLIGSPSLMNRNFTTNINLQLISFYRRINACKYS